MALRVVAGTAHGVLARAVAGVLDIGITPSSVECFPDGELRPVVEAVRGDDVYLVQPTGPPAHDHIMELMLLLDACRRAGARRLTAVVPYFGYGRQDRRNRAGQPVGARVVLDALVSAGAERLVVVDPHTSALEGMCSVPVEMLTAAPVIARTVGSRADPDAVVVAPDLGAVKLAERYASILDRPVAVVRKTRVSGSTVIAEDLVGDVRGRSVIIVDDMISTGGTIEAAARVLAEHGSRSTTVAATHAVLVGDASARLAEAGVGELLVTDTLPLVVNGGDASSGLELCSVAELLAEAISRLHV